MVYLETSTCYSRVISKREGHKGQAPSETENLMSEIDTEQATREHLDEFHPEVNIGDNTFDASRVLEELDPIAFHQYELDLIDSNVKSGNWFEWDDESIHDEPEEEDEDDPEHNG